MGFSSGKSKAKRKAQQAQHDAYVKALKSSTRAEELGNQTTNNYRTIRDKVGEDNLDGYSKALLRKADSMSRDINSKSGEVNAAIGAYNERYDKLQRQLNGESIHDGYDVEVNDPNKARGGLMGIAGARHTKSFDDLESAEAYQAQSLQPAEQPKNTSGFAGFSGATGSQNNGIWGQTAPHKITADIKERTQTGINNYRGTLTASRDAYNDLDKLSQAANTAAEQAGLTEYETEYQKVADRLRNSLRRSQGLVKPTHTGLLGAELAQANPIEAERLAG